MLALAPGVLLLALSCAFWAYRRAFKARARRVEGTVVRHDFRVSRTRRGYGGNHYPVIGYEVDGVQREVTAAVGNTSPRFKKRAQVGVLFLEGKPEGAVLDTTLDLYFYAIVLAAIGTFALCLGAWSVYGPR